jgi:death on curing protein
MNDDVVFLSIDDVMESHLHQVQTYGGDAGLRDAGLLESAIAQPQASFGGEFLHVFPFEMAAAYLYHLVMNHPFVDGNKRVGLEAALIFLELNGIAIDANDDELVAIVLDVATGKLSKLVVAEFLRSKHVF